MPLPACNPHVAAVDTATAGVRRPQIAENLPVAIADAVHGHAADRSTGRRHGEICVLLGPSGCGKTPPLSDQSTRRTAVRPIDIDGDTAVRPAVPQTPATSSTGSTSSEDVSITTAASRAAAVRVGRGAPRAGKQLLRRSTSTRRMSSSAIRRNCRAASSSGGRRARARRDPPVLKDAPFGHRPDQP